jgi:hypothetical protein
MSPEEARQVGRRVGEDCAWVAATMQALTDEYQRTTGECDRVHSMPLEGVDDVVRRFDAIGAKVQAEEGLEHGRE